MFIESQRTAAITFFYNFNHCENHLPIHTYINECSVLKFYKPIYNKDFI